MRLNHPSEFWSVGAVAFGVQLGAHSTPAGYCEKGAGGKLAAASPAALAFNDSMPGEGHRANTSCSPQIDGNGPKEAELINAPASLNLSAMLATRWRSPGPRSAPRRPPAAEGEKKAARLRRKTKPPYHHMKRPL